MPEVLALLANWMQERNCGGDVVITLSKRAWDQLANILSDRWMTKTDDPYTNGILLTADGCRFHIYYAGE